MVAPPVAVLGSVERRRSRVGGQHMDGVAAHPHGNIPVRLRRQPQPLPDLAAVVVPGQQAVRHLRPELKLEGPHRAVVDGRCGVHGHAVLAGEEAEAPGIVAGAQRPVPVEIQARVHARVDGSGEGVGEVQRGLAVLAARQVVVPEQLHAQVLGVVVELVDQQDVGGAALDDLGDRLRLGIAGRGEIPHQLPLRAAVERGVVGHEAQRPMPGPAALGGCGGKGDRGHRGPGQASDQAAAGECGAAAHVTPWGAR